MSKNFYESDVIVGADVDGISTNVDSIEEVELFISWGNIGNISTEGASYSVSDSNKIVAQITFVVGGFLFFSICYGKHIVDVFGHRLGFGKWQDVVLEE